MIEPRRELRLAQEALDAVRIEVVGSEHLDDRFAAERDLVGEIDIAEGSGAGELSQDETAEVARVERLARARLDRELGHVFDDITRSVRRAARSRKPRLRLEALRERIERHHLDLLLLAAAECPHADLIRRATSLSPITIVYGIFWSDASRIFAFIIALPSSNDTRTPCAASRAIDRARVIVDAIGDGHDRDLDRREPHRERAGEVLDQDRDEPLERAVDRAVDHDRAVVLAVLADVGEVEALGRGVVELDRAELPLAADAVGDVEVDLRAVERAVAGLELVREVQRSRARP